MPEKLCIAQITDIHISPHQQIHPEIKVCSRMQFSRVLTVLKNTPLDAIVISGDLALSAGELESYQWIKQQLAEIEIPIIFMAGNHDCLANMLQVFPIEKDINEHSLYFKRVLNNHKLLFLDSSSYRVSRKQLEWVSEQAKQSAEEILLFIHHPPQLCGCAFMDERHSLQNIEETWAVLRELPNIRHIFCGHYHAECELTFDDKNIHVTPSTFFQIDKIQTDFKVAHTRPAWRMIEWDDTGLRTHVEYLA